MSVERPVDSRDLRADSVALPPFDLRAWLEAWQEEFLFFRVDALDRFEYVCPTVDSLLGYAPDDLIGGNYRDLFDVDHPMCARRRDGGLDGLPQDAEQCVVRDRGGKNVYFLLRQRELVDPDGVYCGKEMMAQDITRRVEAEIRLRLSERKFRRLVEGFRGGYIIYTRDARGLITYVSPSIESVLGYRREDVMGRNWREFIGWGGRGRAPATHRRTVDDHGHELSEIVVDLPRSDGVVRTLEIQEWATIGINGRRLGREGIAKDVTDARQAELEVRTLKEDLERRVAHRTEQLSRINEELSASEARYRNVVESQKEFICRWRPDGIRTFVNDAYCRFLGKPASELLNASVLPEVHPDDRHLVPEFLTSLTPENCTSSGETRHLAADGSVLWAQWSTLIFFDELGRPTEFQSVGRDVTELKAAADLLRQKEAHLAHLSRLATMGEMVAGIAHELGQPLHAAKTFAEAARRHLESARFGAVDHAVECTHEISQAVLRTVEIIRRLRAFTKSSPVKIETIDLNAIVRGGVDMMAYELRRVGATFRLELTEKLAAVKGDRIQLEQLCVNLLKNACDAMLSSPRGERQLLVSTAIVDHRVCLSISDTGCGINAADAAHIFDAFYSTKPDGMGMGLSLCKSIADAHGMQIGFTPNENQRGTTFHVSLPCVAVNPA